MGKKNSKKILNIYSVMMIVMFFPYSRERERRRDPTPTQRYITSDPSLRDSCVILLLSFSRKKKKLLSFLSFFMKTCNLFRRCCWCCMTQCVCVCVCLGSIIIYSVGWRRCGFFLDSSRKVAEPQLKSWTFSFFFFRFYFWYMQLGSLQSSSRWRV